MIEYDTIQDYGTSMFGVAPYDLGIEQIFNLRWPQSTDVDSYSYVLVDGNPPSETAFMPFEKTTVSLLTATPLQNLITRLDTLQNLSEVERWPGSIHPTTQAFRDARLFVCRSTLSALPTPTIVLADDGEINFLWSDDGVHVDLGFYGTGTYSYFARGYEGQRIHGEDVPASEGLSSEIIELLAT